MEFFHKKTSYPFMATRRRWYMVSAILIVGSLHRAGRARVSISASTSPAAS